MKKGQILLIDRDFIENRALTRVRSVFDLRDGIFTSHERILLKFPNHDVYFSHPNLEYESLVCNKENLKSYSTLQDKSMDQFENIIEAKSVLTFLDTIDFNISEDLKYLDLKVYSYEYPHIIGAKSNLYIHNEAIIHPGVIFDTRQGPIIIDSNTEISPFSYICGPVYVGSNSKIDCAKISGPTIIGHSTRIGGEVEASIINDYSNKHHEGFLGHSIVGSWVNLGALTTTSDLKNNYGEVKLQLPRSFKPFDEELVTVNTATIKFGSIIGDCVKIGIGTMLNTGSVIDFGANIFNIVPNKYTPPLSWQTLDVRYELEKFYTDSIKIFARRNKVPHPTLRNFLKLLER